MTNQLEYWLVVPVFAVAAAGTQALRRYGQHRLLDIPNERSSHVRPVPRGGGVAIVVAFLGGCTALWLAGQMPWRLWAALVLAGGAVAAVGFWDDHEPLSARVRLVCHLCAALVAVVLVGRVTALRIDMTELILPAWIAWAASVAGITWLLNLYNFMDGIDGIAAAEGSVVAIGAFLILAATGSSPPGLLLLAAATAAFLIFNWSPARIFMGDAGSGFIGFSLGIYLLASTPAASGGVWLWLILLATFWVDATVTLLRRLLRGQRWYVSHRSHAYQHATRRYGRHGPVAAAYVLVTAFVLTPIAWTANVRPHLAGWLTLAVFMVLACIAVLLGAGKDEVTTDSDFDEPVPRKGRSEGNQA